MNKNRQRRHRFYYEKLKRELKFKEAVKALPINIEMLTKENRNDNKTWNHAQWANRKLEYGAC